MRIIPPPVKTVCRATCSAKTRRSWSAALLSLAVSAATVTLLGCDSPESLVDKQAEKTVQSAIAASTPEQAESLYQQAAAMPGMSSSEAARTNGLYAQALLNSGQSIIRQAQAKEIEIARLINDIQLGTNQVQQMQDAVKAQLESNPQAVEDELTQEIAAATGNPGADGTIPQYWTPLKPVAVEKLVAPPAPAPSMPAPVTSTGGSSSGGLLSHIMSGFTGGGSQTPPTQAPQPTPSPAPTPAPEEAVTPADAGAPPTPLHTLGWLNAQIAQLNQQIQNDKAQADQWNQKKLAATEDADKRQQKSEAETGQAAVDDYVAGVNQQKAADDLAVKLEMLDGALANLQADLARYQSEQAGVQKAITGYQQRMTDLAADWKSTQDSVNDLTQKISTFVGGAGDESSTATLSGKMAALAVMIGNDRDLRGNQAAPKLAQAITWNESAAKMCRELYAKVAETDASHNTPMEAQGLIDWKETFNPAVFRLAEYSAELAGAENAAAQAITNLSASNALRQAQTVLGSIAPSSLDKALSVVDPPSSHEESGHTGSMSVADLEADAADKFTKLLGHYDDYLQTQKVTNPSEAEAADNRQTAALVGKMLALYGAKQLSEAEGGKPVAGIDAGDFQGLIDEQAQQIADRDPTMLPAIPNAMVKPGPIELTPAAAPVVAPVTPTNADQEAP